MTSPLVTGPPHPAFPTRKRKIHTLHCPPQMFQPALLSPYPEVPLIFHRSSGYTILPCWISAPLRCFPRPLPQRARVNEMSGLITSVACHWLSVVRYQHTETSNGKMRRNVLFQRNHRLSYSIRHPLSIRLRPLFSLHLSQCPITTEGRLYDLIRHFGWQVCNAHPPHP